MGQIATQIFYRTSGVPVRSDGAPIIVALAAERPPRATPPPAAATDPAIRDGEFAPWGLTVGRDRR